MKEERENKSGPKTALLERNSINLAETLYLELHRIYLLP